MILNQKICFLFISRSTAFTISKNSLQNRPQQGFDLFNCSGGGNIYNLLCLGISAFVAFVVSYREASKSPDLNPVPFLQAFHYSVEELVFDHENSFLSSVIGVTLL